jgi:hypothetical protein
MRCLLARFKGDISIISGIYNKIIPIFCQFYLLILMPETFIL